MELSMRNAMRKALASASEDVTRQPDVLVASLATVLVTSESSDHPIDNAFDGQRGPGSTMWIAATPGEQEVIIAFDSPQAVREIIMEVEERDITRTQEVQLSVLTNRQQAYRQVRCQEFTFHPDATYECENWAVNEKEVTHLRLYIKPDKGGRDCFATLTSLVLRLGAVREIIHVLRVGTCD
jgi:hypothetical protein